MWRDPIGRCGACLESHLDRNRAFQPSWRDSGLSADQKNGASRARTDDLYRATVALSQLSYSPSIWF